ncbi:hypothetical protein EMCRGX_G033934 [Ephydatia muelleri]
MFWEATTPAPKGRPRHHAWYKERLDLKFLKTFNPSSTLDGERWIFVANDMDDFRTSLPAQTDGSKMVMKNKVNRVPLVSSTSCMTRQASLLSRSRAPDPARMTVYSKVGPRRQLKEKSVSTAEAELLKHPLDLFPHLGDAIPQELRGEVINILDPVLSRMLNRAESDQSTSTGAPDEDITVPTVELVHPEPGGDCRPNIYHWPLVKTLEEINNEQSILASQKESRVNDVTHQLVQWAKELGGNEEIHIDEGVVKSLFASDYETKPFLSAPLRVVEMTNVPMELISHSKQQPTLLPGHCYNQKAAFLFHDTAGSMTAPRLVKSRYGAWYLPVSLWKRKLKNDPLTRSVSGSQVKSDELAQTVENEKLLNLHGAKAFKEFLVSKPGAIIPQFLTEVKPKQP